ncbi:MAG TPA: DUF1254 domain-containing protein [Gaiellaceae bacterium]
MSIAVNVENFARAESDRMFASFADDAGGVNRLSHYRAPTAVDRQPVIRMNRDTLYSAAVVDISEGAHHTIPDGGRRYVSVMVVDQAAGYFEPNDRDACNVNNLTATPNDDGSVTVHFGGDEDRPNLIPIMDGWNYTVRLYRPRPEVLKGSWTFPEIESA